jgi:hypothetical protein
MEDYDELRKEVFQKKVQDIFFKKPFNLKRY